MENKRVVQDYYISIHAPRGGSDAVAEFQAAAYQDFNPRSPWGERLQGSC